MEKGLKSHSMFKVALTGNVGSGKSTVARIWSDTGVPVVRADDLALTDLPASWKSSAVMCCRKMAPWTGPGSVTGFFGTRRTGLASKASYTPLSDHFVTTG